MFWHCFGFFDSNVSKFAKYSKGAIAQSVFVGELQLWSLRGDRASITFV
jgi:hypothetical protein